MPTHLALHVCVSMTPSLFIDGHGGGGSGSKGTTTKPANAAKMMLLQRSATSGKLLAGGGASGIAAGSPRSVSSEPMTATVVTSPRRSPRHHHQHVDLDAPKAPVTVNAVHIFLALCMYCGESAVAGVYHLEFGVGADTRF